MALYGPPPHHLASGNPLLLEGGSQYDPRGNPKLASTMGAPSYNRAGPQGFPVWEWGSMGVVGRCTETEQNTRPGNTWAKKWFNNRILDHSVGACVAYVTCV